MHKTEITIATIIIATRTPGSTILIGTTTITGTMMRTELIGNGTGKPTMAATIVITRSSARKISGLTGPIATIMTKITTTTTTVTDNDWEVRSAGRSRPAYQDLNRSTRSYLINIRASEIAERQPTSASGLPVIRPDYLGNLGHECKRLIAATMWKTP